MHGSKDPQPRPAVLTAARGRGDHDHPGGDPFDGPGEMCRRGRMIDWAATPLGPVEAWSPTLRSTVRTCMQSPFPINLWCGPDLVLIYNDAYREVLGSKHPSALGRTGSEVWSEIWGQVSPMFDRLRAGGGPIYADDAPFLVHRASGEDGSDGGDAGGANAWFTFALSTVRDDAGEIVAFLNIVSETTRRILAERAMEAAREGAERARARLKEVFAQAPSFMAVLRGRRHVFEYANEAYYSLVGRRDLIGKPVVEALPELRGQGFDALLDGVLATGKPYVGREVSALIAREPGSAPEQHYLDFVYYPITEADGSRTGIVAHGSDVTDHVMARNAAQQAHAAAEKANRAKSQFLANMSHEIRTPINAVIGYADLLDAGVAGPLAEQQQQYVDRIRGSSRHLLVLVNDVLDLSKIEAGEVMIRSEQREVGSVLAAALHVIAPDADARSLSIREDWRCSRDARFTGDEDRVRQVVLNLLSNAVKFTEPGGRICVRCRIGEHAAPDAALPETGPWVVIEVEDSGTGIAPDQLDKIFDAFVQVDDSVTRRAGGAGLGLAISRRFARLMGGDLTVRSEPGTGSCFSLWLPSASQGRAVHAVESLADTLPLPDAGDQAGLAATAQMLLSSADAVEEQLVERLTQDPDLDTDALERVQLADHTAALLAVFGRTLTGLDLTRGRPGILEDGEAIRSLVADRHGRQRHRIGWQRHHVQREYALLLSILESMVHGEVEGRHDLGAAAALTALRHLVHAAEARSLAAFDSAATLGGGTPASGPADTAPPPS
jgi:signal transduction histidine kinase